MQPSELKSTNRAILWSVALLVLLAPLPIGSAEPWCAALEETVLFVLVGVFTAINLLAGWGGFVDRGVKLAIPWLLLAGLALFQITPLPPPVLSLLSPATYRLYSLSLPGWPAAEAYSLVSGPRPANFAPSISTVGPHGSSHPEAALSGAGGNSGEPAARGAAIAPNFSPRAWLPRNWRPLSIAPSLSRRALLKLLAYGSLLLLVTSCPAGPSDYKQGESSFQRLAIITVLASGLLVAALGIIEVFTWNGKILWFFVPYDWGAPQPGLMPRACGPFVNPDHFGDYLAMTLPLAAGGAVLDLSFFQGERARAFRLLCAATALVIAAALLLSLSRGAWIGAFIGLMCLAALTRYTSTGAPTAITTRRQRPFSRPAIIGLGLIVIALIFIGPHGRVAVDGRLRDTVQVDDGLGTRLQLAVDTLRMTRNYPVFGVGLGSWPELFPQYRMPPWFPALFREAHNDYAQVLAETGIAGMALVIWFLWAAGRRIHNRLKGGGAGSPVLIMACAGVAAAAFHEFFDFSLQKPANALLTTFLLALAIRVALIGKKVTAANGSSRLKTVGVIASAVILATCAIRQEKIPYPYNLKAIKTAEDAVAAVRAHPAESAPHMALALFAAPGLSTGERMEEMRIASRLDPINPEIRDLYARGLMRTRHSAEALTEVRYSIQYSPSLASHFYLREPSIRWLTDLEAASIEQGFKAAAAHHYEGARRGLAEFYTARGRFVDAAWTYLAAASGQRDEQARIAYLREAGVGFARAGEYQDSANAFRRAIAEEPEDSQSYGDLLRLVLGPARQFASAATLVDEGVRAGAAAAPLYDALAEAAYRAKNLALAESALDRAIAKDPSFADSFRLGRIYLEDRKYDRAALILRRAVQQEPRSADAYFNLGVAEEADYHFVDAENDLSCAVKLAPKNITYRDHYREFEQRLAASEKPIESASQ
jgi:O-antigen ligase/tetratricopeptide (TPR) repeat protein